MNERRKFDSELSFLKPAINSFLTAIGMMTEEKAMKNLDQVNFQQAADRSGVAYYNHFESLVTVSTSRK